jgi:hypothetical protein
MKKSESFVNNFKTVNIEITTNVDDESMKSMTPPTTSFMDFFNIRKNSISEDDIPEKKDKK